MFPQQPPSSLPGLGFVVVPRKRANKMDLMQDTRDLWSLPRQVGVQGYKSALGTCPESGTGGARSLSTCAAPHLLLASCPSPSQAFGPHPHCRERALPCAHSDWQWLLLEIPEGMQKDMRSTVAPASTQGLGLSLVSRRVGLGEIQGVCRPRDSPWTCCFTPLSLTRDTGSGSFVRCSCALVALALPG